MGIKVIVDALGEPVSQLDCERHLERDGAYDSPPATQPDAQLIMDGMSAAREHGEDFTSLSLVPKTLELALDRFSETIELPRGPVQSITSVSYVDEAGALQVIASTDYYLDTHSDGTYWLLPADGFSWPSTQSFVNSILIRYVAGYSLPGDSPQVFALPKSIRQALLVTLKSFYDFRDTSDIPEGAKSLLWRHRKSIGV